MKRFGETLKNCKLFYLVILTSDGIAGDVRLTVDINPPRVVRLAFQQRSAAVEFVDSNWELFADLNVRVIQVTSDADGHEDFLDVSPMEEERGHIN